MSKYVLYQDMEKCIGCHACEIQCKANKSLPRGPKPCAVMEIGEEEIPENANGNVPAAAFVFLPCFHCDHALCVDACPTGAMQKREKDGIVFVDQALCVGCKACISACPYGAPQWDPQIKRVVKCDLCKDRLDTGLLPACVTICITGCLHFAKCEDAPEMKRKQDAQLKTGL